MVALLQRDEKVSAQTSLKPEPQGLRPHYGKITINCWSAVGEGAEGWDTTELVEWHYHAGYPPDTGYNNAGNNNIAVMSWRPDPRGDAALAISGNTYLR